MLKVTNMPTIPNEKTWPHKLRKFINKNIPSIKHWLRVDELQNPLQIYQFFFSLQISWKVWTFKSIFNPKPNL